MAGRIGFFGFDGSRLINRLFPGGHSHYFVSEPGDVAPFMRRLLAAPAPRRAAGCRGRSADSGLACRRLLRDRAGGGSREAAALRQSRGHRRLFRLREAADGAARPMAGTSTSPPTCWQPTRTSPRPPPFLPGAFPMRRPSSRIPRACCVMRFRDSSRLRRALPCFPRCRSFAGAIAPMSSAPALPRSIWRSPCGSARYRNPAWP